MKQEVAGSLCAKLETDWPRRGGSMGHKNLLATSFMESVGLEMSEEDKNLPYLYWTPKLHKVLFKHRFIAGSSKLYHKRFVMPAHQSVNHCKRWAN